MDDLAGEIIRFLFAWFVWIGWVLMALPYRVWIDNREARRTSALRKQARAAGDEFIPQTDDVGLSTYPVFQLGASRTFRNVISGSVKGCVGVGASTGTADAAPAGSPAPVEVPGSDSDTAAASAAASDVTTAGSGLARAFRIGDCCYVTQTQMHDLCLPIIRRHFFTWCLVEHPLEKANVLPDLTIRPEGLTDKIKSAAGFEDINFESAEYSRTFYVQAADRKYAYAVITPRSMELQLTRPSICLHLNDRGVLVVEDLAQWPAESLGWYRNFAVQFLDLIPDYLYEQYKRGGGA